MFALAVARAAVQRVGDPTSASRAALRGCEEHRAFCGRRRKRTEKISL